MSRENAIINIIILHTIIKTPDVLTVTYSIDHSERIKGNVDLSGNLT